MTWSLEQDTIQDWAYWDNVFTKEECETIIKEGKKLGLQKGTVNGSKFNKRKSSLSWIYPTLEHQWMFQRVTHIVKSLNNDFFQFDLHGFDEGFQFTHYKAPGGAYGKHVDRWMNGPIRKLSITIQLSDPSTYKGGDLVIGEDCLVPREQGKLIAFPSFIVHEVTPVTKGERYSLVAWITGKKFK